MELHIDPERLKLLPEHATNVQLRVQGQVVDIIVLDKASLTAWLRTGGENLALNLIGMFMGHGPLV